MSTHRPVSYTPPNIHIAHTRGSKISGFSKVLVSHCLPEELLSSSVSTNSHQGKQTHPHAHTCTFHYTSHWAALLVCLQLSSLSGQLLSITEPTQAILDPNHANWSNEMEGQVDWAKTNTANTADDEERAVPESCNVVVGPEWAWLEH